MGLGPAVEWQDVALLVSVMGGLATPIIWTWRDNRAGVRSAHRRIDEQEKAIAAYKLEVARTYVTSEAIGAVERRLLLTEERMVASMEKLGDRIDRAIERGSNRSS